MSTVSGESFLLLPITPDGPRLIQPTTYSLRLPSIRPSVCGMVPEYVVERQTRRGHAAIADGANHQLRGQLLAHAGVLGDHPPAASVTSSLLPSTIVSTRPSPLISIGDVRNRNTIRRLAFLGAVSA